MEQLLTVRGDKQVKVTVSSARLKVDAHGKKRFIIALKYEGEKDYRYLVATDLSWRTLDIAGYQRKAGQPVNSIRWQPLIFCLIVEFS